jgi:hypothetical protein
MSAAVTLTRFESARNFANAEEWERCFFRISEEPHTTRWGHRIPVGGPAGANSPERNSSLDDLVWAIENAAASPLDGGSLGGKRILVVEDEPLLEVDIASQLEETGAHVAGLVLSCKARFR